MTTSTPSRPALRLPAGAAPRRAALVAALIALAAMALVLSLSVPALGLSPTEAAPRALDYLHAQWKDNGGFATNSPTGDLSILPWAVMAISAAGYDPASWALGSRDPVTILRDMDIATEAVSGAGSNNTPAFYAKLILAFTAAGRPDLAVQAGKPAVSLADELLAFRHADSGHFSMSTTNPGVADISTTTWAILALSALGSHQGIVEHAAGWLRAAQAADGGFSFQSGAVEDVDDTGAAIQALLASGASRDDPAVQAAAAFLRRHQNDDGGFVSWVTDTKSTAESTAWALQALNALGEDLSHWARQNDPAGYLLALQEPRGCFAHRAGQVATPLMTTTQAIIALAGRSFPFSLQEHKEAPEYLPAFTSLAPTPNTTVSTDGFQISAEFADEEGGTGIDPAQVRVLLDGTEVSLEMATVTENSLALPTGALAAGAHEVTIIIADHAGHVVTATLPVTAAAPTTTSSVSPTTSTTIRRTTTTIRAATGTTRPPTGGYSGGQSTTGAYPGGTANTQATRPPSMINQTEAAARSSSADTSAASGGIVAGVRMGPAAGVDLPAEGTQPEAPVTGEIVPAAAAKGSAGWETGLLAGGIAALMPLGAGLSLVLHRRRSTLLTGMFPPVPGFDDACAERFHPGDASRAAWLHLQGRIRHHLTHLPLPDDQEN